MHIQGTIDSRNSAIHNAHHTSLRPSSVFEPRHPSLKVASCLSIERTIKSKRRHLGNKMVYKERMWQQSRTGALHPSIPWSPRRKPMGVSIGFPFSIPKDKHHPEMHRWLLRICANDPSAGSPTETLLRLLLPLSVKVHQTFHTSHQELKTNAVRIIHRNTQSVGATGGVYKGQGRNQHELLTRSY